MNENEQQLELHYIHGLWTQLTRLIGINIIDTSSSQPITTPEHHQAFLEIVAALSQPKSNLNHLHNWFNTDTPIDAKPMKPLQPMVHIQCYLLGEYLCSCNYTPNE